MSDADFVIPFDKLPDGFADTIRKPAGVPVTPRPAATIVLLRDGPSGMELLLMRRNRRAGFVPGAYVFPGGRVDGSDAAAELRLRLDGLTSEAAERRLSLPDADPPALAYYLAALREAFEETGLLVGRRADGSFPPSAVEEPDVDRLREALMNDEVSFADALDELDCRLVGEAIEYIAHWITPEPERRRYDTRFFAAKVPPTATPIIDAREMTGALWVGPDDALARCDRGELPMVFPTIRTIEELADFTTADEALDSFASKRVRAIMPTLVVTPTGVGMTVDD